MNTRGYTLVEVLVAIGIIGILIAIIVPALRGAKGAARETVCLANLKTCHVDMQAYLDAEGKYPFMQANDWLIVSPDGNGTRTLTGNHWDHDRYWPSQMHSVSPWREHFAAWVCPGSLRKPGEPWESDPDAASSSGTGLSSYALSDALRADPKLWYPDPPTDPEALNAYLRPVRPHEVRSPAAKVLFHDQEMAHLDPLATELQKDARPIGFVDGHAAIKRLSVSVEPVQNPLTSREPRRLHDTDRGAHGVDY